MDYIEHITNAIKKDPSIIKKEYLLEIWRKRRSGEINDNYKSKTYKNNNDYKNKSPSSEKKYLPRGNSADFNINNVRLNNSGIQFSPNLLMIPISNKKKN